MEEKEGDHLITLFFLFTLPTRIFLEHFPYTRDFVGSISDLEKFVS